VVHVGPPSHTHLTSHRDKKADQRVQAATCTVLVHVRTMCGGVFLLLILCYLFCMGRAHTFRTHSTKCTINF